MDVDIYKRCLLSKQGYNAVNDGTWIYSSSHGASTSSRHVNIYWLVKWVHDSSSGDPKRKGTSSFLVLRISPLSRLEAGHKMDISGGDYYRWNFQTALIRFLSAFRTDNPGNDKAGALAKDAVGYEGYHPFQRPVTREKASIQKKIGEEGQKDWQMCKKGGHLRRIDSALPARRTRRPASRPPLSLLLLSSQTQ